MGLFGRLALLIRANINDLTGDVGDLEKKLDQAIAEMSDRLIDAKNLVSASIAEETRLAALGRQTEMLEQQRRATDDLKRALVILNEKIEEAKARRAAIRLRGQSAQVTEAIHGSASGVEKENVSELLDRLESHVARLEMQAKVDAELDQQSETALAPASVARLSAREPMKRALGPASTPTDRKEPTPPAQPGDDQRTRR